MKPILFKNDMVRAILDGRKTQLRKIAKLPEKWHRGKASFKNNPHGNEEFIIYGDCGTKTMYCPHGRVGDTLWVRETWRINSVGYYCPEHKSNHAINIEFATLPGHARGDDISVCGDNEMNEIAKRYYDKHENDLYSPSIHMPKWACRIFLEITGIRVERVQEISEDDAIAEGIERCDNHFQVYLHNTSHLDKPCDGPGYYHRINAVVCFQMLWDSINAKRAPWKDNYWVWVIEFKITEKP